MALALLVPLLIVWAILSAVACLSVCIVSSRTSRIEEWDRYVDSTAAQLLDDVEIEIAL